MSKKKLVIDPGHGGKDSGSNYGSLLEKNIVLDIAKRLYEKLKDYNVDVFMTRTTDKFIELSDRAKFANNKKADYFLSIHINSANAKTANGYEDFRFNGTGGATKKFQDDFHSEYINHTGYKDRGKKSENFAVLRETKMIALLTENLFVSNVDDRKKLSDSGHIELIAEAHLKGLVKAIGLKKIVKNDKRVYTVKKGDTLYSISNVEKVTVKKILELNKDIKDPNKISIGQKIKMN